MAVVKCSTVYFCVGPVLVFVGVVLLCAFGFSVLLPHQATRSWLAASCTVANATFEPTQCSCSRHVADARWCAEKYPCLKVFVYHDVPGADNGSTPTALLFRSWGDAFYKNVSTPGVGHIHITASQGLLRCAIVLLAGRLRKPWELPTLTKKSQRYTTDYH